MLEDDSNFVPHAFAELKRSVSDFGFDRILDQLEHAILETVDMGQGTFCVFAIVMKGTKIGLLEYYSCVSLLDDYDILNYKGFVPMTYRMSEESFLSINDGLQDPDMRYIEYKEAFNTERHRLEKLGVKHSRKLRYPYIFDLLNKLCSWFV